MLMNVVQSAETLAPAKRRRVTKPPAERRQEILDAALRRFLEKGYDETTVGDIAADAAVATGTVYLYFPSKEKILLALHERFEEGMLAHIVDIVAESLEQGARGEPINHREVIDQVFDAMAGYFLEKRDITAVVCKNVTNPEPLRDGHKLQGEVVTRILEQGVEQGWIHVSDPEMAAYVIRSVDQPIMDAVVYGDPPDLQRVVNAVKEFLGKALAPL